MPSERYALRKIRLRDRVAHRLANACLRLATKRYRDFIDGAIRYGLDAAARDEREGRDLPPRWDGPSARVCLRCSEWTVGKEDDKYDELCLDPMHEDQPHAWVHPSFYTVENVEDAPSSKPSATVPDVE